MIAYFDTSSFVPLLVDEPASQTCNRLWDESTRVVSARLLYAEARAALAQAERLGRIDPAARTDAVVDLDRTIDELDHVEITERLVRSAGELAEQHGLRGYDAVHLASAMSIADDNTVMVVGDNALADAAESLGLAVARTT